MYQYSDFKIQPPESFDGPVFHAACPHCGQTHPEQNSVTVYKSNDSWLCHHCGWRGNLGQGCSATKPWLFKNHLNPIYSPMPLTKEIMSWFSKRGISEDTLKAHQVGVVHAWNPSIHQFSQAIAFPFYRDSILINVKHRFGNKHGFRFEAMAEVIPLGLDDIDPKKKTIICSDEIEKLALFEAGYTNVISLPFPPPTISRSKKDQYNLATTHEALSFLETHEERFKNINHFVLALGGSPSAQALEEELGRRLGRDRCYTVKWTNNKNTFSEMLLESKDLLEQTIEEAKPYPIKGVFEISDVKNKFDELYEKGLPPGPRTGWPSLDDFYRPAIGQWTLVTGIPSHGKSNFLDALFCNLANLHDWKFCIFSPENQPIARHFANLAEKFIGSPFNPKSSKEQKMTITQKEQAERWLEQHFSVILPDDEEDNMTIDSILALARSVILRKGVQGMVLDPWNEIEHTRDNGLSETEHISRTLSKIRQFARAHSVHIWVVAHPTKMHKEDGIYPVPTPYDVAGSAHFLNKADFAISIYRFVGQIDQTITDIYIQKVRFKENGIVGRASLRYVPTVGQFVDDIDQGKRNAALNKKETQPTEHFIVKGKVQTPEFHDDISPKI